jgi:hypothetical protein
MTIIKIASMDRGTTLRSDNLLPQCEYRPRLVSRRSFTQLLRWDGDLPSDLVGQMWQNPETLLSESELLQDKLRCTVARIDHPTGQFVWKHHNWGSWQRAIGRLFTPSVARTSWCYAALLLAAGVSTPRPRAYLERRIGPFQRCSYLLTDYVAGTSLYRIMRYVRPTSEYVQHLAQQVASIWQQLDELCLWHNDFKTENLLVDPASKVWLIDLEKARRFRNRNSARQRQALDAARLFHPRNWRATPWAAEMFRQEILKTPAAIETLASPLGIGHPLNRPVSTCNQTSQLVTVMIPCRNAEETICACIESVRDTADEILVADRGSSDATLHRARESGGCRIIQRHFDDELAFERWANCQASHAWVLRVLPNERLDAELSKQVQDITATDPAADGFRIVRVDCSVGDNVRHGRAQRDQPIRLYRKHAAQFQLRAGHFEVTVDTAQVGRLSGCVIYNSSGSFSHSLSKVVRCTDTSANSLDIPQQIRPAA